MSKFDLFLYNEKKARRCIKIASTAMICDLDPENNRYKMASTIDDIMQMHPDVELVIFGEMVLGWYIPGEDPAYHKGLSEPIPGKTTQVLAVLAQRNKIYISFGISELDGEDIYNSQVLLNPQGEIQALHRKSNLKPGEMAANYQPGPERVTTTDIKGIKTGVVICSDTASLHTMRELMRSKFELIIHGLADDDQDDFATLFQARMYDAWFVTANRFGNENDHFWPGLITITDPLGKIRSKKLGSEHFLVYELQFAEPGSRLKQIIRNIWVKTPIVFHILKNWSQAKTYL